MGFFFSISTLWYNHLNCSQVSDVAHGPLVIMAATKFSEVFIYHKSNILYRDDKRLVYIDTFWDSSLSAGQHIGIG